MTTRPATLATHHRAICRVIDTMRRSPGENLDLASMARLANMSRFHFLRTFSDVTGISPSRFLASLRMQQAKELLVHTSMPITAISLEVGYRSLGTFTSLFSDFVGLNPRSFRQLATSVKQQSIESFVAAYLEDVAPPWRSIQSIKGSVLAPPMFEGWIFVGLFSTPIPQKRPHTGLLLLYQGRFELPLLEVAEPLYLLAAAFPVLSEPLQLLLPEKDSLLVASRPVQSTLVPDSGQTYDLRLHPLGTLNPPILIALPVLLALTKKR